MKRQRTSIGLDVHARSVVGCALDGDTGEVVLGAVVSGSRALPPRSGHGNCGYAACGSVAGVRSLS